MGEYFQLETKMGDIEGNSKYPRPMPGDAVRLTEARFRDPVAHAVKSSTTSRNPDAFADIYLTALVAGCSASAVAAMFVRRLFLQMAGPSEIRPRCGISCLRHN